MSRFSINETDCQPHLMLTFQWFSFPIREKDKILLIFYDWFEEYKTFKTRRLPGCQVFVLVLVYGAK